MTGANKKYMNMKHLEAWEDDASLVADFIHGDCKSVFALYLTLPAGGPQRTTGTVMDRKLRPTCERHKTEASNSVG